MGPGEFFPALSVFVNSPIKSLAPSSRFAFGKLYAAAVYSVERGNFPNDVWAYLESNAWAKAVKPIWMIIIRNESSTIH